MKVNVDFATFIDEIEFKAFLGNDISKYKQGFEEWYFRQTIINDIPVYPNQIKYKYFDAEPIIGWMNEVEPTCNAKITRKNIEPGDEDTSLQYMYF
jgi:hypothetical protein